MTQTTQPLTLETLNQLYALAAQMTWAELDQVQSAVFALPTKEAVALVRGFSKRRVASRSEAARRVWERFAERKGRSERGEEIGRIARS